MRLDLGPAPYLGNQYRAYMDGLIKALLPGVDVESLITGGLCRYDAQEDSHLCRRSKRPDCDGENPSRPAAYGGSRSESIKTIISRWTTHSNTEQSPGSGNSDSGPTEGSTGWVASSPGGHNAPQEGSCHRSSETLTSQHINRDGDCTHLDHDAVYQIRNLMEHRTERCASSTPRRAVALKEEASTRATQRA